MNVTAENRMPWSTEETRKQAADLTMRKALSKECWEGDWTPEERRDLLKNLKAERFSGIDRYPETMYRTFESLMAALEANGLMELYEDMDYRQQGAMLVAFKEGYEAGREWEKKNPSN